MNLGLYLALLLSIGDNLLFLWRQSLSVYLKEPEHKAQACVIWMHGLGADASDMAGLADQLTVNDVAIRHVFIDAPMRAVTLNGGMTMRAWYDIVGLELTDRVDQPGIKQSELLIRDVIDSQLKDGFAPAQIYLAGFSQGGAMALHTALHSTGKLAGVIALSAYLPLAEASKAELDRQVPFFIASGKFDPLVLPIWTSGTKDWLLAQGYANVAFHQYPMEHSICFEEIKDISLWLSRQIQGDLQ